MAMVTGVEDHGDAAARGRGRLERAQELGADPAAAMLLADDERDHARPWLAVLEWILRTDPAKSRDRTGDVDDEQQRLRLVAKSLQPDRRHVRCGGVAKLAEQRRYRRRVV